MLLVSIVTALAALWFGYSQGKHTAESVQWFHDPVTGLQATFWFPDAIPGRMPAAVVDARTERRLRESIKANMVEIEMRTKMAQMAREADEACANAARYEWLRGELQRNDPLASVTWKTNGLRHSSNWCNIPNGLQLDFLIDRAMK
jgi:hypothetical protein